MDNAALIHRLQFAFTVTFHYIFPQLTMGLALLLVVLKTLALRTGDPHYDQAARFWARIFAINFAMGVVTGIPMEFQFGTNWARFSKSAGGVIGQTLGMEGMFSFFLESTFLGVFLYGEERLGPRLHWLSALCVFLGSWLSGYFIIATDAWMQHPVSYTAGPDGMIGLASLTGILTNPWIIWQYSHNMLAAVVTGSFVMSALGAFYLLTADFSSGPDAGQPAAEQAAADQNVAFGRTFVRLGVIAGTAATVLLLFPTGDQQGKMVALHQPATLAAMEGLFSTQNGAPLALIGQPDIERQTLDNVIAVPRMLSFLTYKRWNAQVRGLDAFPRDQWPDNVALLYFSYHIMVGLGTLLVAVMGISALLLKLGRLYDQRAMLWILMLAFPFPYIATTAGWMTAEMGRQPWLIYGVLRTVDGTSSNVSSGSGTFTLLGFMGLYFLLGVLFLFLVWREVEQGPSHAETH